MNTSSISFEPVQIERLRSLRFMHKLDDHIHLVSSIIVTSASPNNPYRITLVVDIYHEGTPIENISFDLNNYSYEEIVDIAKNIKQNEFILYEIDTLLSGEIE